MGHPPSFRYVLHPAPGTTGDQEVSQHIKGASHPPPLLGGSSLRYLRQVERDPGRADDRLRMERGWVSEREEQQRKGAGRDRVSAVEQVEHSVPCGVH